jgi:hypothetical protein
VSLTLHLDASTLGLSNGAPCSTWTDSSASGNNATSSGSARPTFAAGVSPSGHGALLFTASSSQFMTLASAVGSSGSWSCYIVYKKSSAGVNGVLLGNVSAPANVSGQDNIARYSGASFNIYFGSPYLRWSLADSAAWEVVAVSHDGSNNVLEWLNTNTNSGTAATTNSLDTIGHRGYGEFFDGYIAEIQIYDSADSAGTLATNGAALYAKWVTSTPATTLTLTGPTGGTVNVASTNYTVTPNGTVSSDTVTPHTTSSGSFSPSSLTWTNDASAKTFTYTPSSTAGSPHSISITDTASLTISGSPISYSVNSGTTTIPVTDANFKAGCSPYNWYNNGTCAETNNSGASLSLSVVSPSGTNIILALDTSPLSGAGSGSYPYLRYRIGNAAWTSTQLTSGQTTLTLASGLSAGTYDVEIQVYAFDYTMNRWNPGSTPYGVVRVTGLTVTSDCSLGTPSVPANNVLVLSDSIGEGLLVNLLASPEHDAFLAFGSYYAAARNARAGNVCFGGIGLYLNSSYGEPAVYPPGSPLSASWQFYHSGASRLVSGALSPVPSEILIVLGTNDALNGVSDANVQASIQGLIGALRAAAPAVKISVGVPFGGFKRAALTAGFTAAADANSRLIDLGTTFQNGLAGPQGTPTWRAPSDGIHMDVRSQGEAAARMLRATSGGGFTVLGSAFIQGR